MKNTEIKKMNRKNKNNMKILMTFLMKVIFIITIKRYIKDIKNYKEL